MRLYKVISLIFIMGFLAGCATTELEKSQRDEIRNIGLVVLLNDYYSINFVGVTVFNNKFYKIHDDYVNEYIETVSNQVEQFFENKNYNLHRLNIENQFRNEYHPFISKKLSDHLIQLAESKGVDTIVMFHDGSCFVSDTNRFGASIGFQVSGHGLARRITISAKQYACLTLDIIKVDGFNNLVVRKNGAYETYFVRNIIKKIVEKDGDYQFTELEKERLRENTKKLFSQTVQRLLERSKF